MQIYFDGTVLETYPTQIAKVYEVILQEPVKPDEPLQTDFGGIHETDDFILTISSEFGVYSTEEPITIWATLEYIGEQDSITIWHGLPFITFSISDGRDFVTEPVVIEVLESTDLLPGKVYHFDFQKSGSWSSADPKADFWEGFFGEEELFLPSGNYTVTVYGAFSTTETMTASPSGLNARITILVE